MFGWLSNVIGRFLGSNSAASASSVQQALNAIADTFRVMYGYWHTVATRVTRQWQGMAGATLHMRDGLQRFMFAQGLFDNLIIKHIVPWLGSWISWLGGRVRSEINQTIVMLRREYKAGDAAQHAYTRSVLLWVILHVLVFLFRFITTLLTWVARQGATMWHYFTHLDAFAMLLFWHIVKLLESLAWDVAKVLGEFFLALIVRHVVRFATLIETIVDAVL